MGLWHAPCLAESVMLAMPPRHSNHRSNQPHARHSRSGERGFTLAELMVVVAIVGILATLATYGVRKYVLEAKKAEASSMLVQIRAAEEAYKDEIFVYLGAASGSFANWHPVDAPGNGKYDWGATSGLRTQVFDPLGVRPDGPVQYVYCVVAGVAGGSLPASPSPAGFAFGTQTAPWYIAMGRADLNGDGTFTYATTYSGTSAITIDNGY